MSPETMHGLELALNVVNVLVLPALVSVGRWLMKVELRLSRIEWAAGAKPTESVR